MKLISKLISLTLLASLLAGLAAGILPPQIVHAEGVVANLSLSGWGRNVAVDPVRNQIYTLVAISDQIAVINGLTHAQIEVPTGFNPVDLAVNPTTGKVYVANYSANTVTVFNPDDNSTATLATGTGPISLAINPVTNRIYVVCKDNDSVTIIDGGTHAMTSVSLPTGAAPRFGLVNPVTNKIYTVNDGDATLSIIDGASLAVQTITPLDAPVPQVFAAAINPITNKIYLTNNNLGSVSVVDGATLGVTIVPVGAMPNFVAVNPVTNKIYVSCQDASGVTIIDGASHATTEVALGPSPTALTINPTTNQIYVASWASATFWHIDGNSAALVSTFSTPNTPSGIAIHPITNRLYIANEGALTVMDGASNTTLATINTGGSYSDMQFNPITNRLYMAFDGDTIQVMDGDSHARTAISTGAGSGALGINPVTNKIYTANLTGKSITVIDGATQTTLTNLPHSAGSTCIAVNPVTNKIYANLYGTSGLVIVDGSTDTSRVITPVFSSITAIAVNPATNRVYFLAGSSLYVLDGASDSLIATLPAGTNIFVGDQIAINPVTNTIYFTLVYAKAVAIVDGSTHSFTTRPVGAWAYDLEVNPTTNKIYIADHQAGTITVLDGVSQTTQTISGLPGLNQIAVNPISNKIYATVNQDASLYLAIIDGTTLQVTTLAGTSTNYALAVNLLNNQVYAPINAFPTASFKIINEQNVQNLPHTLSIDLAPDRLAHTSRPIFTFTPAGAYSPTNPPIQNVFYQVDTWTGAWQKATWNGSTWSGSTPFQVVGPHVLYAYTSSGLEATSFARSHASAQPVGRISAYGFYVLPSDILYVDDDYTPATIGWSADRFATLSGAIQAAYANKTVIVNPGSYSETVTLSKELTLRTEGAVTLTGGLTLNAGGFSPNPGSSLNVGGSFTQANASVNLGTATLSVGGSFSQSAGTFNLNTGTLALGGGLTRTGGSFDASAGTLTLNGHGVQTIPSGITPYNLNVATTDTGLVGYWPMDEGSGDSLADASGGSNPAVRVGAGWTTHAAPLDFTNPAGLQTAPDAYAQAPHANSALDFGAGQDFSLALWVKMPTTSNPWGSILSNKDAWHGVNSGFILSLDSLGVNWLANVGDGTHTAQATGGRLVDDQWHHLAATFDRDGVLTVYQDGTPLGTASLATIGSVAPGQPLAFGRVNDNTYPFTGTLDDLRIYNRVLSSAEVGVLADGLKPGIVTLSEPLTLAGNLGIGAGAILDVSQDHCAGSPCAISLGGNWTNAGTFYPRSGAVHFNGSSSLGGATLSSFFDIFLESASSLTAPAGSFSLRHVFTNNGGTFNPNGGTVIFDGESSQTLPANIPFHNLTLRPSDPDLVGYWRLDEASGLVAADASGHGNHGVLYGDYSGTPGTYPVWTASGAPLHFANPQALSFNRSDRQRVEAPLVSTAIQNLTLAAWVKADQPSSDYYRALIYNGSIADGAGLILDNNNHVRFSVSGMLWLDTDIIVPAGTWTHVAAVGDSSNQWRFYQDGALVKGPVGLSGVTMVVPTQSTVIGNASTYSGFNQPMEGQLDDVRFYNRALAEAEVAALGGGHYPNRVVLSQSLDVNGSLTIDSTSLDVSADACGGAACPITVAGDWVNNGSFNPRGGTVTFDGAALQTLSGSGRNDFAALVLGGATTLVDDQSVPAATAASFSASADGARLRRSQAISALGAYTFGLTGVSLEVTADSFTAIQIERVQGNHPNASSGAALRTGQYWSITPTGSGVVDLTLPHAGLTGSLTVCRYLGPSAPGQHWNCTPASASTATTVTLANVSSFSEWTVGSGAGPTAIQLAGFAAHPAASASPAWLLGLLALAGLVLRRRR